jgi:MYXO-CTERM domain-containing protein
MAQAADDYVREKPWAALAAAALVGLAAGFLLSRRPQA